jgi:hypothetical protein
VLARVRVAASTRRLLWGTTTGIMTRLNRTSESTADRRFTPDLL